MTTGFVQRFKGKTKAVLALIDTATITTANITTDNVTTMVAAVGNITALGIMPTVPVTSVTAAGGNIATAAALSSGVNIVAAADDAKGVILPAGASSGSKICVVINTVSNKKLQLYPPSGGTVDGGSASANITMGNGSACFVFSGNATAWYTVPTSAS